MFVGSDKTADKRASEQLGSEIRNVDKLCIDPAML